MSSVVALFMLVVVLWVAALSRRAMQANARRKVLGSAVSPSTEHDGRVVTLRGRLRAEGSILRFEDGKSAAIASYLRDGAVIDDARAATLMLECDDGKKVALRGPIQLLVGKLETRPRPGTRGPIFRSVRAGDEILAEGVLSAELGHASGYRGAEVDFSLGARDVIRVAYTGIPALRGFVLSALLGPRERAHLVLIVPAIGALLLVVGAIALRVMHPSSPAAAAARPVLASAEQCQELRTRYEKQLEMARTCAKGDECVGQERGRFFFSLDGCARWVQKGVSLREADATAERWVQTCAKDYDTCREPGLAQCFEGRCVERPPNDLPRDWKRYDAAHLFSLFMPPDAHASDYSEDSIVKVWQAKDLSISTDYGAYSGDPDPDAGPLEAFLVDGRKATLGHIEKRLVLWYGKVPPCSAHRCGFAAMSDNRLTLFGACGNETECALTRKVFATLEVFGDD